MSTNLADQLIGPSLKFVDVLGTVGLVGLFGRSIDRPFIEVSHSPSAGAPATQFGRSIDRPFIEVFQQRSYTLTFLLFGRSIDRPFIEVIAAAAFAVTLGMIWPIN